MYIALLTIATSNTKLLQFLDIPTLAPPARHYNNCIFCELLGHAPGPHCAAHDTTVYSVDSTSKIHDTTPKSR